MVDRANITEAEFTMLNLDKPETDNKILNITPEPFLCEMTWDISELICDDIQAIFDFLADNRA
jgi:hypothetical protein